MLRLRRSTGMISLSWGLLDQVFSSATNFALAVIAGRIGGPEGLGVVYLGFSAYLVLLTMQRALITDPLIVASTGASLGDREPPVRAAVTVVAGVAVVCAALFAILGVTVRGAVGQGLLLFAPWLVWALLQDFWRALLFRDGRGRAAALNDGVWAAVMAVSIVLLLVARSQWIIVLTWGLGAFAGGMLGFWQTRLRPAAASQAWRWWQREAWPLARWLGPESALLVVQMQVVVFALVAIVGARDVGGLRAVQAVFAPMSLLAQAIVLPGLPMLVSLAATSRRLARTWALRLSAIGIGLVLLYLAAVLLLPRHLVGTVFGSVFNRYDDLIVPTGIAQLLGAGALGLGLLVKAEGRVRALLLNRFIVAVASLALSIALGMRGGVTAAVWGMAGAAAIGAVSIAWLAFRPTPARDQARSSPA